MNPDRGQAEMIDPLRANSNRLVLWGVVAGFATCVVYPLIVFSALPDRVLVVLAASMGPFLGIASWGLRQLITLHRPSAAADLGALGNAGRRSASGTLS